MFFIIVLLVVSYMLELYVWLKTLDVLLGRKYNHIIYYMLYILGEFFILCLKQVLGFQKQWESMFLTVVMIIYMILVAHFIYNKSFKRKLIVISIIYMSSLAADVIVFFNAIFLGLDSNNITEFGVENAVASFVSKLLLFFSLRIVFIRQFDKVQRFNNDETAVFIFGTLICELPCIIMFSKMNIVGGKDIIFLLFGIGQILICGIEIKISMLLSEKKKNEKRFLQRIHDMDVELNINRERKKIFEKLRGVSHDMKNHLGVIKTLASQKKCEEMICYIDKLYNDIVIVDEYIFLDNLNVSIILNQEIYKAKMKEIMLDIKILVKKFYMNDVDICAVLSNVLDNAIEASSVNGRIYVKIEEEDGKGHSMICENNYNIRPVFKKGVFITQKSDKDKHGCGIKVIRKIVEKYKGKAKFYTEREKFIVEIYIPEPEGFNDEDTDV